MLKKGWWFIPLLYLSAVWVLFMLQPSLNLVRDFGLYPRDTAHLTGIITTPFLHSNLEHISANTISLGICLFCLYYFYMDIANSVLLVTHIFTGLLIWLFARPAFHIGASGVVYGLELFLLISGFIRRNRQLKILALTVLSLQTGLVWGILPQDSDISWESHLFGALTGTALAIIFRHKGPHPDPENNWQGDDGDEDEYGQFSA